LLFENSLARLRERASVRALFKEATLTFILSLQRRARKRIGEGQGEGMPPSIKLRNRARELRRQQTDVETKLWMRLRDRQLCGVKYRRQLPIGPYIVDFCSAERGLVVELDGGQHAEQTSVDQVRTQFLEANGYRIVRFWNHEVLDSMDSILEEIVRLIRDPHPSLSLKGRGSRGRSLS
jgi:adenine-specific DNA-methyltransferase